MSEHLTNIAVESVVNENLKTQNNYGDKMSGDVVVTLRIIENSSGLYTAGSEICREAADEVDRLRTDNLSLKEENTRLEKSLKNVNREIRRLRRLEQRLISSTRTR
jgi:hypothetical protein